ncbi:MAG TPA: hypothetical protein VFZ83_11245 [Acidimicrobiia bacterium]|nr:hypothetical protein [Acidimicrobiia bacterium]
MSTLDAVARTASAELRDRFADHPVPDLDESSVRVVELVAGEPQGEPPARHRLVLVAAAVAAAVGAFGLGSLLADGGDRGVELAGPQPLTRVEWVQLANEQCAAATARPGLPTDDPDALLDAIAGERTFNRVLQRTATDALERGVPSELVDPTRFARDGLDAIDRALAAAERAARVGDAATLDAQLSAIPALSDRILLRLAQAGATGCAPEAAS